jgi:hypothetical protein
MVALLASPGLRLGCRAAIAEPGAGMEAESRASPRSIAIQFAE